MSDLEEHVSKAEAHNELSVLEALTDLEHYYSNLIQKPGEQRLPLEMAHTLPFPFDVNTNGASILGFYEEPNFFSPNDLESLHFGIDFFLPVGTPIIAPADGFVLYIRTYEDSGSEKHDMADIAFYTNGVVIQLVHVSYDSTHNRFDHLLPAREVEEITKFHTGSVKISRGEQIATVAQWPYSLEEYEKRGINISVSQSLTEHYTKHNLQFGSHLHITTYDLTDYENDSSGLGYKKMSSASVWGDDLSDERKFNPLHLFTRIDKLDNSAT